MTGADFSPKPPIVARSAHEQANAFLLPAGYRLETSLQCCRMCAAVVVASVAGPIEVVYAERDPGRFARGTALQRLGWERPAGSRQGRRSAPA